MVVVWLKGCKFIVLLVFVDDLVEDDDDAAAYKTMLAINPYLNLEHLLYQH